MTLGELLHIVIEDGLASLSADLVSPTHAMRLKGGRAGLEACRMLEPGPLRDLLLESKDRRLAAEIARDDTTLHHLWFEAQVEFVARVMSVGLELQNQSPIATPDAAAFARYVEIVGWGPIAMRQAVDPKHEQER